MRGVTKGFADLLEGKAEDGDLLAGDGVEHGGDDHLHKAVLLVVIDLDHRVPVVRHPLQPHALTAPQRMHRAHQHSTTSAGKGCAVSVQHAQVL